MDLKKLHLWFGVFGVGAFLLSGQYFLHALNGLQDVADTPRLLLRTSHIYLFLASVINIVLGLFYQAPLRLRRLATANQLLMILSPLLISYGFIYETAGSTGIDRSIGSMGIIIIFVWLAVLILVRLITRYLSANTVN